MERTVNLLHRGLIILGLTVLFDGLHPLIVLAEPPLAFSAEEAQEKSTENPIPSGLAAWNASLPGFYLAQQSGTAVFSLVMPDGPNGISILQNTSFLDFNRPDRTVLEASPFSGRTLRLEWNGSLKPGMDSGLVADLICDGDDASLVLARGVLFWAGLRGFYHERFTNSDDYMQLFWMNPDEDIENVRTQGMELFRGLGPFFLHLLYVDFETHTLKGFRLTRPFGRTAVGLTGAWGRGEVIGLDLDMTWDFADFVTEVAVANGSMEDCGIGLALKRGRFGPLNYEFEYLLGSPGFSTPDADWQRGNCERVYGTLNYRLRPGLSLNGSYEFFKTHDYSLWTIERTIGAEFNLWGPYNLALTCSIRDGPEVVAKRFEINMGYMDKATSASLILRYETLRGFEEDFTISRWFPKMNSRLTVKASFLMDSLGCSLVLTRTLPGGSNLILNCQTNYYSRSQGRSTYNLTFTL